MSDFSWTGNPFVDTGLAVLVARSGKRTLSEVTKNDLNKVFKNNDWVGDTNRKLKAYSSVIINGPLTQNAYSTATTRKNALSKLKSLEKQKDKLDEQLKEEIKDTKKAKLQTRLKELRADIEVLQGKISSPSNWNIKYYRIFIDSLIQEVNSDTGTKEICEVTGLQSTNVFNSIGAILSDKLSLTSDEKKKLLKKRFELGRDWFPLAGSLGNDAQALPAGSRSPHISSLALLMAQLLPLGVIAISRNVNGKMKSYLVCLQFNVPEVNELIVKGIYEKVIAKVGFASEKNKLKTIGTEKGSKSLALFLLNKFRELKDHKEFHNLGHLHLNVWFFSNFGTSADCDYFEIPNSSLRFLQTAAQQYYDEIKEMLVQTRYRYSLLEAIERNADYEPLYPYEGSKGLTLDLKQRVSQLLKSDFVEEDPEKLLEPEVEGTKEQDSEKDQKSKKKKRKQESLIAQLEKKQKSVKRDESLRNQYDDLIREIRLVQSRPASKDLFKFYQINVVQVNPVALSVAERIALFLKQNLSGEKGQKLLAEMKQNNFKISAAKTYLVQMAMEGKLTLDEYTCLFPMETMMPLRVSNKGWKKYIWFYLNHDSPSDNQTTTIGGTEMFTHPKIKVFAKDYFDYFMEKQKGSLRKFELYVLEPFERGQVTSRKMQEWYCELAKAKEGYTCDDWDDLCKDENGNDEIYEVRFQMRLHFINLYREFKSNKSQSTN